MEQCPIEILDELDRPSDFESYKGLAWAHEFGLTLDWHLLQFGRVISPQTVTRIRLEHIRGVESKMSVFDGILRLDLHIPYMDLPVPGSRRFFIRSEERGKLNALKEVLHQHLSVRGRGFHIRKSQ